MQTIEIPTDMDESIIGASLAAPSIVTLTKDNDDGKVTVVVAGCLTDYNGELVYLNITGSRVAVRTVWASLMCKGRKYDSSLLLSNRTFIRPPANASLRQIVTKLPSGMTNLALLHSDATVVGKGDPFYVVIPNASHYSETEPPTGFFAMLNARLQLPLTPAWEHYLWNEGLSDVVHVIQRLPSVGFCRGFKVYTNSLEARWKEIITRRIGG